MSYVKLWVKSGTLSERHTCPLAAEFVFDIIGLMSEELNDFIFIMLNNCFTLEKKKKS